MSGTIPIQTERLLLRRYRMDDAEILYRNLGQDPSSCKYSGWNPYADLQMAENSVRMFIEQYDKPHFYGWMMEHDGSPVGTIGAYDYDAQNHSIEIGMSVFLSCRGHGYAAEAVSAVLRYLLEEENISAVTAWCATENTASSKVLEKAGMRKTHTEINGLTVNDETYDRVWYTCTN
ncbi:MAG: GNAT family N-acetyltransferase [Solobacterium sp.]|nr:GNAT family N-acetyltransferase [Solobacterium sp.]